MNFVLGMWSVWVLLVLVFMGIKVYTARLNRDEDDTLFLDDTFAQEKAAQAVIIAKVKKIQPVQRGALIALSAMSLFVLVFYIWDAVHQFS